MTATAATRSCPRRDVRCLSIVLALLVAGPAAAEPGFVWQAADESCPDADEVQLRIERRLGVPLEVSGVEVAISREGADFVATIDMRGVTLSNQNRRLASGGCDELADAVAVVVARLASEAKKPQVAVVEREPAAAIAVEVPPPERPRRWGGGLRSLALSGVGAQPRVGLGGEIAGFVRRERWYSELAYTTWRKTPAYLNPGAPGGVAVGLETIALRFGWSPADMPIRAWVSGEIGHLVGQGIALLDPRMGSGRWTAIGSGFGVAWPIANHVRLIGSVELAIPTERPVFSLASGAAIYQSSSASARCALGFEVGWR